MRQRNLEEDYEREFNYVRKTYFPLWDRKQEWKLQVLDDDDGAEGHCNAESKTIRVQYTAKNRLRLLFIHEIAHAAATYGGHGKKWLARMEKAAKKAESIGEIELSGEIRKDVESYRDPENVSPSAAIIYQQIEDVVLENSIALPFDAVMDYVRRLYGMSMSDFLKKYKRVQRVFDAATEKRERLLRTQRKLSRSEGNSAS
jgi:hypothetical protein